MILDLKEKGYITPSDLLEFCAENGINVNYYDAFAILSSFDSQFDGKLRYEMF